jgi:hypothetical protein
LQLWQRGALNATVDFMGLDYSVDSTDMAALKTDGIAADDLQMTIAHLKATQRIYTLVRDVDHASTVMAAGYASARDIATERLDDFQRKTGLPAATARKHHHNAGRILAHSSQAVMSAADAHGRLFDKLNVGNVHPDVHDYLKKMPGFAELFQSQDYCRCSECQSIIGAAAYFVDLMTFVDENVTRYVFDTTAKAKDQLNLFVRRPDLWTVPLTCDNTNTLIPYLDIINPVLENYIATSRGMTASALGDRTKVEDAVYRVALTSSAASFAQPFTLPLTTLDTYLQHFSVTRAQIARALGGNPDVVAKGALKLSDAAYKLLATANTDLAFLKTLYGGLPFVVSGAQIVIGTTPPDVQDVLGATGLSRADFGAIAATHFVTNNGTIKLKLDSEKLNKDSLQHDVERVTGLTADALDRLHRFTRLQRATPWTIAQLDLVLDQLAAAKLATGIQYQSLRQIPQLIDLQTRLTLPVDQTCALWGPVPRTALDATSGSLFDRMFNLWPFAQLDGQLPNDSISFVHGSFCASGAPLPAAPAPGARTGQRLLAALQVTDADLVALITELAPALGAKLDAAQESDRGFALTAANLTLLYRHAQLAQLLDLSVADLFQLIGLAGIPNGAVSGLKDLLDLLDAYDWQQSSSFTLDDLGMITHGSVGDPSAYPAPPTLASAVVDGVAKDHALEFSDTVFTSLRVTEQESRAVLSPRLAARGCALNSARSSSALRQLRAPSLP